MPYYFHFMGKTELQQWPLFNIFFKGMNIPLNRTSVSGMKKAFIRAEDDIDEGIGICIFPEGTIPSTTPKLDKFKNGPFKLAIDKQVPVVPITFIDGWKLLPDGIHAKKGGRPGIVKIFIHKPIETTDFTQKDLPYLREQVFKIISEKLREHGN